MNTNSVDHYFSFGHFTPSLLDQADSKIGITNAKVSSNEGTLTCSFNRDKFINTGNYYNFRKEKFYALAAYGSLDQSGGNL